MPAGSESGPSQTAVVDTSTSFTAYAVSALSNAPALGLGSIPTASLRPPSRSHFMAPAPSSPHTRVAYGRQTRGYNRIITLSRHPVGIQVWRTFDEGPQLSTFKEFADGQFTSIPPELGLTHYNERALLSTASRRRSKEQAQYSGTQHRTDKAGERCRDPCCHPHHNGQSMVNVEALLSRVSSTILATGMPVISTSTGADSEAKAHGNDLNTIGPRRQEVMRDEKIRPDSELLGVRIAGRRRFSVAANLFFIFDRSRVCVRLERKQTLKSLWSQFKVDSQEEESPPATIDNRQLNLNVFPSHTRQPEFSDIQLLVDGFTSNDSERPKAQHSESGAQIHSLVRQKSR
ncbi:hypothetical protein R3P38DRAFT_3364261, partial [Favolaschia claudopus]